jgi:hypothetical protein
MLGCSEEQEMLAYLELSESQNVTQDSQWLSTWVLFPLCGPAYVLSQS